MRVHGTLQKEKTLSKTNFIAINGKKLGSRSAYIMVDVTFLKKEQMSSKVVQITIEV